MRKRILLDTDIGNDIDDAVCLAYLLANPRCEILGITTVSGEPEKRAQMASAMCIVAGKDIPIYPGAPLPFLIDQRQQRAPQSIALKKWEHQVDFPQGQAVDFLRRTIHANPGEITLLTIGPLTNIALLFLLDPEIPSLLNELVTMCGIFTNRLAGFGPREWNAMLDPHATAVVYKMRPKIHRSIGLDVTCQVRMNSDEVRRRFQTPMLKPVLDFAEIWFKEQDHILFHDPLAATTIFNPEICSFERGLVEVELESSHLMGLTHWNPDATIKPHEVALSVDADLFFKEYFSVF